MFISLRIFTFFILAFQACEEDSLTLVSTPQLNGSVAHPLVTTLGTLSLDHWTISLLIIICLLLGRRALQTVEVDLVLHRPRVEQDAGDHELADNTRHITSL